MESGALMRRRDALKLVGGAAAGVLPFGARAQQAMPVIGYLNGLSAGDRPHLIEAFRQGLADVGYVVGRNVAIEYRYADNSMDRLREHAAGLISRKVAVIAATGGNNSALAAKALTSTIPILFTSGLDPVRAGLVASLGRPEGNVTGVSWFSVEMPPKQIEVLREMLPQATVVGLLIDPNFQESLASEAVARQAAPAFGVRLLVLKPSTRDEISAAFETLARERVDAAIVGAGPYYTSIAKDIIALAERHRIPVAYSNREWAEAGGLVTYGNSIADAYRRVGNYAARILKGTKPADLPVDRAVKFELIVSLKAAKALGLTFPHSLLSRADDVID
jgi:putative ABC transport system substrate-binding protein